MKRKIKVLSYLVIFTIMSLSVGYSAFGTKMNITDIVAEVRVKKDIRVTGFSVNSRTNNAESEYEEYNHNSISSTISMPQEDSTVSYNVQVTNIGNIEMGIYEFVGLPENIEIVMGNEYNLKTPICNDKKCSLGVVKEFTITIKYKEGMFNQETTQYNLKLDVDFRQMYLVTYEGITNHDYQSKVMEGDTLSVTFTEDIPKRVSPYINGVKQNNYTYENGTITIENITGDVTIKYVEKVYLTTLDAGKYFKEEAYINNIQTISFVNYVDTTDSLKTYELGETGYESEIIGWIDSNYNLYIGSDLDIYSKNLSNSFSGMSSVTNISFYNLNTSESTNMTSMFSGCSNLTELDLTNFNTQNVTTMNSMFHNNESLSNLYLSSFNTENVTNMFSMFYNCKSLTTLDLTSFNTKKVTNMSHMFHDMTNLSKIALSNFNTEKVTNMSYMFAGCSSLTELDLGNFVTKEVFKKVDDMFYDCKLLTSLNIKNIDLTTVTSISRLFGTYNSNIVIIVKNEENRNIVERLLTNGGTVEIITI